MIVYRKEGRKQQMLLKVTAREGDDLWILTDGEMLATVCPTTKEKAMKYLTKENGWTLCCV